MKRGDVVVNIEGAVTAVYFGWVAGNVSTYTLGVNLQTGGGGLFPAWDYAEQFTGTVPEMLVRCSEIVNEHNDKVQRDTGGRLI